MDWVAYCLEQGANAAEAVETNKLVFSEELRTNCEMNHCGCYGRNYTCPPLIGDIKELIAKVRAFPNAVVFQTIHQLEDSFDVEGMWRGQEQHNAVTHRVADQVYQTIGRDRSLVLGAGACTLCETCAARNEEPCRYPDRALSSVEAHGLNVASIGDVTGLRYINGQNTVTYFSAIFYNQNDGKSNK